MKILIIYYSRSGHNKKMSERLAETIGCDIEEIVDMKSRAGIVGWIIGGRDSMKKQLTQIAPTAKNPADYDLTILVSPIWVGATAPAIREYIIEKKDVFSQVALVSVCGSGKEQGSIADTEALSGLKLSATLFISDTEYKNDYQNKFDTFVDLIKK